MLKPTLVVTKYTLPPGRPRQVARDRLMEKLLAGLDRKLTLIAAPAGFGKSTLAAELARRAGRPAAWLSLDRTDNDPLYFGAYLTEALRQAGLPVPDQMQPTLDALAAALINAAAVADFPLLLVLDDYHLITAGEIHEAVALLVDRLPPGFHVVIVTRTRPPLPLARLKARGEMAEITAADLRFTAVEAAAFVHQAMGVDLPDAAVAALVARTEGWAAGLQLAALSLQGAADWAAALEGFSGASPDLLEYLMGEVVGLQPEPVQLFLLHTSILGRLTGPLCGALTGLPDSQRTLQVLEQANLFLFPLDPGRRWYRYHPLFAEFLQARLRDEVGAAGVADLHRRAARWYRADGQVTEAVDHLLAAGAGEEAADWMEEHAAAISPATLLRWVGQLPAPVVRQRPRVATMAAWALISSGDGLPDHLFKQALEYLTMAARELRSGAARADAAESLGILAAVRTALAPWAPLRQCPMCTVQYVGNAVYCAEEARQLLPEESCFWRSVVSSSLGAVHLRAGNLAEAARAFGDAARLGTRSGDLSAAVAALQRQAGLLVVLGRPGAADTAYREALRLAGEQGGESLPLLAPIYLGLGRLRYEANDLNGAADHLGEAIRRFSAGGVPADEAVLALARVRQAQGDSLQARRLVDQAAEVTAARAKLRAAAAAAWPDGVRVLLDQGDVAGARRWVDAAGVGLDREPDLWRAPEYLALARVLVAEGQADAPLPALQALRDAAAAGGCRGTEAEVRVVEALALHSLGDDRGARVCVQAALALTAAEGHVRLFADGGRPILTLVGQVCAELRRRPERAYAERLLAQLTGVGAGPGAAVAARGPAPAGTPAPLVEPLTTREREIVQLLAAGCSNQDIARELYMGVSTVKWHLLNIFGKLQVRSRTQAVARARESGLV